MTLQHKLFLSELNFRLNVYIIYKHTHAKGFPSGSEVKNPLAVKEMQEMLIWSLGWEDHLEEGMATHFSILAWEIPWTEETGRLSSKGNTELDTTEQLNITQHMQIYI